MFLYHIDGNFLVKIFIDRQIILAETVQNLMPTLKRDLH